MKEAVSIKDAHRELRKAVAVQHQDKYLRGLCRVPVRTEEASNSAAALVGRRGEEPTCGLEERLTAVRSRCLTRSRKGLSALVSDSLLLTLSGARMLRLYLRRAVLEASAGSPRAPWGL